MRIGPRCRCQTPDPACGVCRVMHTRNPTSYAWGGFVVARLAEWEQKAAPAPKQPPAKTLPLRPLPCIDLGKLVKRAGCRACPRDDVHECEHEGKKGQRVTQNGACETCSLYTADGPASSQETPPS